MLELWLLQQSPKPLTKSGSLVFSYSGRNFFSVFPQARNLCIDRNTCRLYRPKPLNRHEMAGKKRKAADVTRDIEDLQYRQERTEYQVDSLTRRVDRLERSTALVVENSQKVEAVFAAAEETRAFKTVAKGSAEALLVELAELVELPYPVPASTPQQWLQQQEP